MKAKQEQKERDERLQRLETESRMNAFRQRDCTGDLAFGTRIGMKSHEVAFCSGRLAPDRQTTRTTAWGVTEQWVYLHDKKTIYFFFVGDTLKSVQQ